jgi:curli biogenesis system outer membrane secretion channel CsgG
MHARQPVPPQRAAAAVRRAWLTLVFAAATLPLWVHAQTSSPALQAVVVWDFDNQSPPGLTSAGASGDFLKRSLSESLTAQLLQVPGLPVLERQRLHDLLAEQKVAASELADQDSRVRLGRVVGARRMVFGGYLLLGEQVQVHVRVVDTATSRVLFSDEASAELAQVMQQVQPLNQRLARALGGTAAAAASGHPAASWQAYDQALALADAGRIDDAVQALQNLLARDKTFTPAERQLLALLDKMARR